MVIAYETETRTSGIPTLKSATSNERPVSLFVKQVSGAGRNNVALQYFAILELIY